MFIAKRCNIVRKGFVFYIHSVDQTKCNIEGLKSANWELFTSLAKRKPLLGRNFCLIKISKMALI